MKRVIFAFHNFTNVPEKQSVDYVQGNNMFLLWELHKIRKYISLAQYRLFSGKLDGVYSNNWALNVR